MNFDNIPSKMEVMSWNASHLADYLKKMRLSGCEAVVKKCSMSGSRFLKMSDSDLQKFPRIHVPLITQICSEINRSEEKRGFIPQRSEQQKHQNQGEERWDSVEFEDLEDNSDTDYEEPEEGTDDNTEPGDGIDMDTYVCALEEETEQNSEDEDDYEIPPSEVPEEIPRHFRLTKPVDEGDYIDSVRGSPTHDRKPRPPQRPVSEHPPPALKRTVLQIARASSSKPDSSPQRPSKAPSKSTSGPAIPQFDRSKKPGFSGLSGKEPAKLGGGSAFNSNTLTQARSPKLKPPKHQENPKRFIPSQNNKPPLPPQPNVMVPNYNSQMEQDMDPKWYVGQVTRQQAESSLRRVNKDGSFLVRDSSKGSTDQPYTLMVLNQQKVYNIQIRYQGNKDGYSLGTGLKSNENFFRVKDIVTHHTKTQLLLIDAMERASGTQHQCCLMHPVGL